MVRILINGINGKMGRVLLAAIEARKELFTAIGGVDPDHTACVCPIYDSFAAELPDFDVLVDFSVPSAAMDALEFCSGHNKPIVLCTTGLDDKQEALVKKASETIPVFRSGNMSLGIHVLRELCRRAARALDDSFDIEIIETHHNRKIDAPSGTAKMLAASLMDGRAKNMHLIYGRHSVSQKRASDEIGVHSVRGGTVVGEHEVLFLGENEAIALKHQALSKSVFAEGALDAALFLLQKPSGLYDMQDLVNERI